MRYITASFDHLQEEESYKKAQDKVTLHLESLFLFALVWSVGGSGAENSARHHFDGFLRAAVAEQLPGYQSPSGEKYTLPEDIPADHAKLKVRAGAMHLVRSRWGRFLAGRLAGYRRAWLPSCVPEGVTLIPFTGGPDDADSHRRCRPAAGRRLLGVRLLFRHRQGHMAAVD